MVSCHPRSLRGQASWPVAKLSFGWIATWTAPVPVRCIFANPQSLNWCWRHFTEVSNSATTNYMLS